MVRPICEGRPASSRFVSDEVTLHFPENEPQLCSLQYAKSQLSHHVGNQRYFAVDSQG